MISGATLENIYVNKFDTIKDIVLPFDIVLTWLSELCLKLALFYSVPAHKSQIFCSVGTILARCHFLSSQMVRMDDSWTKNQQKNKKCCLFSACMWECFLLCICLLECANDAAAAAVITANNDPRLTAAVHSHCWAVRPAADAVLCRRQRSGRNSSQE